MSFPEPLLIVLAKEKQLSERETQVFLALFCEGKTRLEIAERLHVQDSAISTCLSGVYKKFGISESGPVKESRLKDELRRREEIWRRQQSVNQNDRPSTRSGSQDDLFQQVKERCRQKILTQHSRMRLLSGEEIGVDQLYVDVWLLNRSPRTFQVSPDKLLKTFDLRNDRLGLGDRIKRNPGFEVANANPKLVILGKPGAGKTTFLKHLAIDWCKGQFQPDLIAVLIEFRRIRDERWDLLEAIGKDLQLEAQQVEELLTEGKLLVLMDGLDELPTSALRQTVQRQLRQVAEAYSKNRFILTCRTQIITSIPDGFASVEVADFSTGQIRQFVQNWFTASGKSDIEAAQHWETFEYAVGRNPALKELTVTPVLLSLMCLVLQDGGEMPSQVNWLYEKGIKLLLSKWNDAKQIKGWEVGSKIYGELTVERRKALLTEIAARKFENLENFVLFNQKEITAHITQFLRLADPDEGVKILKAIEAQHGLLIERADELWSFSHLTFQEHFTIRWLTQLSAEQLAAKIANKQWQERVKQLVNSQQPADRLVWLIKQAIDQSISNEPILQEFLAWVFKKSQRASGTIPIPVEVVEVDEVVVEHRARARPAIIRVFYFNLASDFILEHGGDNAREMAIALENDFEHKFYDINHPELTCTIADDLELDFFLMYILDSNRNFHNKSFLTLGFDYLLASVGDFDCQLAEKLEQLRVKTNLSNSLEMLREVVIEHRNIGHNWRFSQEQRYQLQTFSETNLFLINLIKIKGAVTDRARTEIEDSLLLPWEELQRRHPDTYR